MKINGDPYVVHDPTLTGREVLTLAGCSRRKTTH